MRTRSDKNDGAEMLSTAQVAALIACSISTVNRYRADGRLPRPIAPTRRLVRWPRKAIEAWLASTREPQCH